MQDIRQKLLAIFQVEHRDHVDQIRSMLALLGQTAGQPAEAPLDEALRHAHTLKGAAHVVELRPVEELAHHLETLFARVRQGTLPLGKDVVALVQRSLDAIEDCVAGNASAANSAIQAINQLLGIAPESGTEAVPEAPLPSFQPLDTVRVNAQSFDGLLRSAVEILAESQRQNQVSLQLKTMAAQIARVERGAERAVEKSRQNPELTTCLNRLQSEARAVSMQINATRRLQQRSSWGMLRLGQQLQRDVWQARMIPAETLLEGYRKMMRDLARDEAKQVEFRAISTGELADRRVIEALKNPLMHALRNAISHGIETPQERAAKGKAAEGLVTLRIDVDRQRLKIAVEDDGRGLDTAKIIALAVERKMLSEADAQRCSQRDLAHILFSPGFSTASTISHLSGRGMGLSIIYEAVQRLQGEVDLQPSAGGGSSLQLSVPVSIATHRLLFVSCANQHFAVPFYWIERLHRLSRRDVSTAEGKPVIRLDGEPVELFSLKHLMGLGPEAAARESDKLPVIIVRSQGKRTAIAVDAFLWQNEAVIQDLGPAAPHDGKISGATLLDDGAVALVLNPASLLQSGTYAQSEEFRRASVPPKRAHSILVVDDSITTRTLEKSILEAHGYRVRLAVDGLEALAQLRIEKVDLVISDVQMPRMDGFELLEAIKKDPSLSSIPVIVVTSLERREDQARGLNLGADAYIVKNKFDQEELLTTIRQIL